MSFTDRFRDFVHTYRVSLFAGLFIALMVAILLLVILGRADTSAIDTKRLIEPRPVDPCEFLIPPKAALIPQILPLLERDPHVLAERAWTPVSDELRTLVDREAKELVTRLLESAP